MTVISPAGHRVLVRPAKLEEKSAGGIILKHDERKEKAQIKGTVIAIGPNAWKAFDDGAPWAAVGDEVYFAQYGGYLIRDPKTDEEFRLLNDEDICAIVRKE